MPRARAPKPRSKSLIQPDANVNVTRPAYNEVGFNEAHAKNEDVITVKQKASKWLSKQTDCSLTR